MIMWIKFNQGDKSERIEVSVFSWYHVSQQNGTQESKDIRGSKLKVRDRIYMRGSWAFITKIQGRSHGE